MVQSIATFVGAEQNEWINYIYIIYATPPNKLQKFLEHVELTKRQGFSLGHFLGHWTKDFENDLNF